MTGVLLRGKGGILSLACTAVCLALTVGTANAQNFNSFDTNHVRLISGFTFHIDGVVQTDLSNIGIDTLNHTYDFGFSTPGTPIVAQILAGSVFGPVGSFVSFSAMKDFGFISQSALNLTHDRNVILNYDGSTNADWQQGSNAVFGGGGGYSASNFGSSDFIRGGQEYGGLTDPEHGWYDFTVNSHSGQIGLAAHFRENGTVTTAPLIIDGFAAIESAPNLAPEGSSLAMLGCGTLPLLGILIKRRRNSRV
jgi:hypothetical protein